MQKELYFYILTVSYLYVCVYVCIGNLYTEEWKMIAEKN